MHKFHDNKLYNELTTRNFITYQINLKRMTFKGHFKTDIQLNTIYMI